MFLSLKRLFLCFILLSCTYSYSQKDTITKKNNKVWNALKYDGNVALKSMVNSFTQPARWKGKDFLTAGSIIAGAGIMYLADNEANRYFVKQGKDIPSFVKKIGFYGGKPQTFFIVSAGVYGLGLLTDNEKIRRTGVLIITSAAASGIMQSVSKSVFGRARPSDGARDEFVPFSNKAGFHSFPSGHAILSFSMAHSIAKQFDNIWVKVGVYSLGSLVPISRLWANAHWLSDVGLGIAISIVTVDGIDNFMKKKGFYKHASQKKISWKLKAGVGTIGVVGTF